MSSKYRVPKRLDIARKMVFFDGDIVVLMMCLFCLGAAMRKGLQAAALALFIGWFIQKLKNKQKKRGVLMHWVYWFTGLLKLKRTPPSEYRTFKE
jgi:type IV conjugative transfer system protein TraL